MSLSPFDSFQSRFVTYLLNFPRNVERTDKRGKQAINSTWCVMCLTGLK